jgi:hypothetical protein
MQNNPQQEAGSISRIPPTMPAQLPPVSVPQTPAFPQYQYQPQYQQYPPVASAAAQKSAVMYGLIGGAIASGIDLVVSLFFAYVPVSLNFLGFLATVYTVNVLIVLLCSPGFFIAGLLATRKTGKMSSAMLACTLALTCFAMVDLCLGVLVSLILSNPIPANFFFSFATWEVIFQFWFIDLILASIVGFGVAALGGAIGRKKA